MKVHIRIAVAIGSDGAYSCCEDGGAGDDFTDAMEAATCWMIERGGGYVIDRFWLTAEREVSDNPPEIAGEAE